MTVLDFGCGPGFFTLPMAQMVGASGHVMAVDLQAEMLEKPREKLRATELAGRISLIRSRPRPKGASQQIRCS
jgi:ubiquinone/menaquinone biosynthesis C-methylase UbiE